MNARTQDSLAIQVETMTAVAATRERQFSKCRDQRYALYRALSDLRSAQERFDLSLADASEPDGIDEYRAALRAAQAALFHEMKNADAVLKDVNP